MKSHRALAPLVWMLVLHFAGTSIAAEQGRQWVSVPAEARFYHTATLLRDGSVLVAGGCLELGPRGECDTGTDQVTKFDPKTRRWSPVKAMTTPRFGHSATLLPDGKVLVFGGCVLRNSVAEVVCGKPADSAETYDPRSGEWRQTPKPPGMLFFLDFGDRSLTAVDDAVLSLGYTPFLFDPKKAEWSLSQKGLPDVQPPHLTRKLKDGKLLVLGVGSTLLLDLATGEAKPIPGPRIEREHGTATVLPSGGVLFAGGLKTLEKVPVADAEQYVPPKTDGDQADPSGQWKPVRPMSGPRFAHAASPLSDGKVLVMGGSDKLGSSLASAEVFDPGKGTWKPAGTMTSPRGGQVKKIPAGGKVDSSGASAPPSGEMTSQPSAVSFTSTALKTGDVLVVGGSNAKSADLYSAASIRVGTEGQATGADLRRPWLWIGASALAAGAFFLIVRKMRTGRGIGQAE